MAIVSADQDSVPTEVGGNWQQSVRNAVRCPRQLLKRLGIRPGQLPIIVDSDFPIFVPEEFIARMTPGDAHDPLLRQVLPVAAEHDLQAGFVSDPLAELSAQPVPGLVQKYKNRALLILSGVCAVNCRYCFRRSFPYSENRVSGDRWDQTIDALAKTGEIDEVIYSGGDPLMLPDESLDELTARIFALRTIRSLRIHTRLPIVIPHRIEPRTLAWMRQPGRTTTVVIHANHSNELNSEVARTVLALKQAGILVLNQAVLLRGVNDSLSRLSDLSWRLIEIGAIPYYLHQLDRVRGAAHFEVPLAKGLSLVTQLRGQLPGYAVPRFVTEEPGQPAKTILL